jgi:hypothetical protein
MEDQMSAKFTGKKKSLKPATVTTEAAEQAKPETVLAQGGRTIVEIAKELKLTPQNARSLARQHASELGHSGHGGALAVECRTGGAFHRAGESA